MSFSVNDGFFETDPGTHPFAQSDSITRPVLPVPSHQSQLSPSPNSSTAYAHEETSAMPVYNAAPSFSPALYTIFSDPRTPPHFELPHPFQSKEQSIPLDSESESKSRQGEPSYAKLIYRALMDTPGHQMVLKDIYKWIAQNTDKARDPIFTGWKNSVRHNLSRNEVLVEVYNAQSVQRH